MKKEHLYCDFVSNKKAGTETQNKSRYYKYKGNFRWQAIKKERYKSPGKDWADIVRQTLIGTHGESVNFHVRYFEIASGGNSSLEMHKHEHVVIGIRGKGICVTGKKKHILNFLDTLYIRPGIVHQLKNPYKEPFGFFCIVNAKRDKPKILSPKPS